MQKKLAAILLTISSDWRTMKSASKIQGSTASASHGIDRGNRAAKQTIADSQSQYAARIALNGYDCPINLFVFLCLQITPLLCHR
jgi:hypothetical protein